MKLLVSTKTKPRIPGDFIGTDPGEILYFGLVCGHSCSCGCGRALIGVDSHKGTTIFKVAEVLRSAGSWQPIITAPKSWGRMLLLFGAQYTHNKDGISSGLSGGENMMYIGCYDAETQQRGERLGGD